MSYVLDGITTAMIPEFRDSDGVRLKIRTTVSIRCLCGYQIWDGGKVDNRWHTNESLRFHYDHCKQARVGDHG